LELHAGAADAEITVVLGVGAHGVGAGAPKAALPGRFLTFSSRS